MASSLGINDRINNYAALIAIREVRNQTVGHPTNYRNGQSYNTIIQISLSKKSFEIVSYNSEGGTTTMPINIENIIQDQRHYIGEILDNISGEIKKRDQTHKDKFKNVKLADCFTAPSDIFYFCEKVMAALRSDEIMELGRFGIEGIDRSLSKFVSILKDRGLKITTYPGIELVLNDCKYPVEKIKEYFTSVEDNNEIKFDKQAVIIFGEYLSDRLKELLDMAKEIDSEYSTKL
jgi:hypothetical protein